MENNTCVCNLNYEGDGITCTGESSLFTWETGAGTGEEQVTPAGLHPDPSTSAQASVTMPALFRTLFISGFAHGCPAYLPGHGFNFFFNCFAKQDVLVFHSIFQTQQVVSLAWEIQKPTTAL